MTTTIRYTLLTGLLAAAFTLLGPAVCSGDVIQLKTGESVKGRILIEESNEQILVFHDLVRGSVRKFQWSVFDTAERTRIRSRLGWEDNVEKTMSGDVLIQKLDDGSREEIRGVIEKEEGGFIYLKTVAQVLKIPSGQIVDRRKETMDRREIYTPDELWSQYQDKLKKDLSVEDIYAADARTKFTAAQFAEWAGALDTAQRLYEEAASTEGYLNAKVAKQRAESVASLIRNAEALKALKHMRMLLAYKNFRKFKVADAEFATNHPEVDEIVGVHLARVKADYERKRNEYFRNQARYLFPRISEKLIEKKVKEKDITVTDVTSWTKSGLKDEAFLELSERFAKKDDISPEEAQAFWDQRKKRNWITRSYGAGTFVVKPAKVKPPKKRKTSSGRGNNQAGPKLKTPPRPTRDGWWAGAKSRERTAFAMAYFAEKSGLFEVGDEKLFGCKLCNATGYESRALQSGGLHRWICTRCSGTKNDHGVRFR